MPISTTRTTVPKDTYALVRAGVTKINAVKKTSWDIRVYITEPGGAAPAADAAYHDWFDGDQEYQYDDVTADIYMRSPEGATDIGVVGR